MTERLSFRAEWFQEEAGLTKKFILNFYPHDSGVEIVSEQVFYIYKL